MLWLHNIPLAPVGLLLASDCGLFPFLAVLPYQYQLGSNLFLHLRWVRFWVIYWQSHWPLLVIWPSRNTWILTGLTVLIIDERKSLFRWLVSHLQSVSVNLLPRRHEPRRRPQQHLKWEKRGKISGLGSFLASWPLNGPSVDLIMAGLVPGRFLATISQIWFMRQMINRFYWWHPFLWACIEIAENRMAYICG